MVNDVHNTAVKCALCRKYLRTDNKQRKLQLFTPSASLDSVTINKLHVVPKTEAGYKYIVVITTRYLKSIIAISTAKTTPTRIANIFMEYSVAKIEINSTLLADNGPQ